MDTGKPWTCTLQNDGLAGALSVAVSPDNKSVYAAGFDDDAVSILSRDPATGALTRGGCVADVGLVGCGAGNVKRGAEGSERGRGQRRQRRRIRRRRRQRRSRT